MNHSLSTAPSWIPRSSRRWWWLQYIMFGSWIWALGSYPHSTVMQIIKQRKVERYSFQSHHFMGNRWGYNGNSVRLYFSGLQNHCRWWLLPWKGKTLTPWKKTMIHLDSVLKGRDITLPTKVHMSKLSFPNSHQVCMGELDHKESSRLDCYMSSNIHCLFLPELREPPFIFNFFFLDLCPPAWINVSSPVWLSASQCSATQRMGQAMGSILKGMDHILPHRSSFLWVGKWT